MADWALKGKSVDEAGIDQFNARGKSLERILRFDQSDAFDVPDAGTEVVAAEGHGGFTHA
jgi:hypothetical protein